MCRPRRNGYIPNGIVELWVNNELVRVGQFRYRWERRSLMDKWVKQLSYGTHKGESFFIVKTNVHISDNQLIPKQ